MHIFQTLPKNNLLTVVNFRNENKSISIYLGDLPEGTKYLTNLIDGSVIDIQPISGPIFIDMNPFEAKVFYLGEEPVSVESEKKENIIIKEFKLYQNYLNPFNPTTTIEYTIPSVDQDGILTNHVTITVYDVLGREVQKLVNEQKQPGRYTLQFNGSNLTSGIYFVKMKTQGFTATKKIVLAK